MYRWCDNWKKIFPSLTIVCVCVLKFFANIEKDTLDVYKENWMRRMKIWLCYTHIQKPIELCKRTFLHLHLSLSHFHKHIIFTSYHHIYISFLLAKIFFFIFYPVCSKRKTICVCLCVKINQSQLFKHFLNQRSTIIN